jgi:hypothetical protein
MTKGFKVPRRTAVLDFGDGDYEGCEVRCVFDLAFSDYFTFERFLKTEDRSQEDVEAIFRRFGDHFLESWNVIDSDGTPVPANGDGMISEPVTFGLLLIMTWIARMTELREVPAPLGETSPNGATSPAAAVQTAPRSQRRKKSARRRS